MVFRLFRCVSLCSVHLLNRLQDDNPAAAGPKKPTDEDALTMFPCSRRFLPINIKGPGPMDFFLRTVIYDVKECKFPPGQEPSKDKEVGCACCSAPSVNIQVMLLVSLTPVGCWPSCSRTVACGRDGGRKGGGQIWT